MRFPMVRAGYYLVIKKIINEGEKKVGEIIKEGDGRWCLYPVNVSQHGSYYGEETLKDAKKTAGDIF